jgi:hypothetical protein
MSEHEPTFYLFSRPTFLEGYGRILDVLGVLNSYNKSPSAEEADFIALRNDWKAVGQDIKKSMNEYGRRI